MPIAREMKRGFTLLELLVVMGIMGMLSVMSIASYRALSRGMEDRAAITAAQSFLDLVAQRAEIDNAPVVVYFYDELHQKASADGTKPAKGNGFAVAVCETGRVTGLDTLDGDTVIEDEFGDLDQQYASEEVLRGSSSKKKNSNAKDAIRMYLMDGSGKYFDVKAGLAYNGKVETYVVSGEQVSGARQQGSSGGSNASGGGSKEIPIYAFRLSKESKGSTKPSVGDAYGKRFANLALPNGYYFRSRPSSVGRTSTPVKTMKIDEGGSGVDSLEIYTYRGNAGSPVSIGTARRRN